MTRNHECKETCPRDIMYIFTKNRHCHEHNDLMLNALGTSVVQIDSKDYKPESPDKVIDLSSIPDDIHQTAGLHKTLSLALGAIVYVTRNIDVSDGIVNGAPGIIKHMNLPAVPLKRTILVKFNNDRVGLKIRSTMPHQYRDCVPIRVEVANFLWHNILIFK